MRVISLHEAESFTGILPQGSLFPTLIKVVVSMYQKIIYFKCKQTEIDGELLVKYVQWTVSQGSHLIVSQNTNTTAMLLLALSNKLIIEQLKVNV
jgi:hypothetical protein